MVSWVALRDRFASSLLRGPFASFCALLLSLWEFAWGAGTAELLVGLSPLPWSHTPVGWVVVGGTVPSLLRSERFQQGRIAGVALAPRHIYGPVHSEIARRLDVAIALARNRWANEAAEEARRLGVTPRRVEEELLKVVASLKLISTATKEDRAGRIRGATRRPTNQERLNRLFQLMDEYHLRRLRKDLFRGAASRRGTRR